MITDRMLFKLATDHGLELLPWLNHVQTAGYKQVDAPNAAWFHFLHASTEEPGMVAYFEKPGKQKATKTRLGRYLKRFFPTLSDSEVVTLASLSEDSPELVGVVQFSRDISAVYLMPTIEEGHIYNSIPISNGCQAAPLLCSCMRKNPNGCLSFYDSIPDLRVAYILDSNGLVRARTLVNTTNNQHTRVYTSDADYAERLLAHLKARGIEYCQEALTGLKGRAELSHGQVLIPYIDGGNHGFDILDERQDYAFVRIDVYNGEYTADEPNGAVSLERGEVCESCGDRIDSEYETTDDAGQYYHSSCYNDLFGCCAGCDAETARDELTQSPLDHEHYCEGCYAERVASCTGCGGEFEPESMVDAEDGNLYCADCAPNAAEEEDEDNE